MSRGKVYLVGAGPGDPELLTLKGLRLIQTADVIAYDRLIDTRLLAHARADAELVDVGKVPGSRTQTAISSLLVSHAREGKRVVRLKGGDPFVFGRGGEEAEALDAAGVEFEIVPGVTSAIAAPAYAGIPVTHRDHASSFTVVTGSAALDGGPTGIDWSALAAIPGTLVFLMAWRNLDDIAFQLIDAGKPKDTPAAVVSWGTQPWQRTVDGRLDSIAETARSAGLQSPTALIIGSVVELRERLNWFETLPLFGRRILVTRTRSQASTLSSRLSELGAFPIEVPTIEVKLQSDSSDLVSALASAARFDWIAFTSANAVRAVMDGLAGMGRDSRALHGVKVAVIGPASAAALAGYGIRSDLVADTATSAGLASAMIESGVTGSRVLLPRSDIAGSVLPDCLRSSGAFVNEVVCYRTVVPESSRVRVRDILRDGVDAVTFTSSSTVRNLMKLLDNDAAKLAGVRIACIGPVTAATAGRLGLNVDIVAQDHTVGGLVVALLERFETSA